MAIYTKWGGGWFGVGDGRIQTRWGGGWFVPTTIRKKMGDPGGGYWYDTGWRGYPAVPSAPWVHAWNYDQVQINWGAGAGGAPVSSYIIQMLNSSGGLIYQYSTAGGPSTWGWFPVSHSSYYIYRVLAVGATGLQSGWSGQLRLYIGKPASTYYTTETAMRGWSKAASVNAWKDQLVGPYVPSNVLVSSVRYQIYANNGFTSVLSPYNNRTINSYYNGEGGTFNWAATSIDQTTYPSFWGINYYVGMVPRGAGWSIYSNGVQRALGTITVSGQEQYQYQQAHTIPAVGNSYW